MVKCYECQGKGIIYNKKTAPDGTIEKFEETCYMCDGNGEICAYCDDPYCYEDCMDDEIDDYLFDDLPEDTY